MGRPPKKGLDYFPRDVDYYDDWKIMDLMEEYGPLGQTVYDVILCMVYHEGYYLQVPDLDRLAIKIVRVIGNRWAKKDLVLQVILHCADIGLFDSCLLSQGVITSAGIQQRYDQVTVRNKVHKEKYWLLPEDAEAKPLLNEPSKIVSEAETGVYVTETRVTDAESPLKERKENNSIYISPSEPDTDLFPDQDLEDAFRLFIRCRENSDGKKLLPEQVRLYREKLAEMGSDDAERVAIAKKAAACGWKNFYPLKKDPAERRPSGAGSRKKPNAFHNFTQRQYDMAELEKKLIRKKDGK